MVLAAAVAVLAVAAAYVVAGHSALCWDIAWTASSAAAFSGMLLARRAATGRQRRRYGLWAAACGSWLLAQLLWNLYGIVGFPQSPNPADAGYWGFALLVIVSLVQAPARSRTLKAFAAAEIATIAAAMALVFAELWPVATKSGLPLAARMSALAYPAVYVSAAVLTLQAIVGGSLRRVRTAALPLVLGGIVAQAVAFIFWSEQLLQQDYVVGATVLDPVWVIGLVAIAAGGLVGGPSRHRSRSPATGRSASRGDVRGAAGSARPRGPDPCPDGILDHARRGSLVLWRDPDRR